MRVNCKQLYEYNSISLYSKGLPLGVCVQIQFNTLIATTLANRADIFNLLSQLFEGGVESA